MSAFGLVPVQNDELEALFEMFEAYHQEVEPFDPFRSEPQSMAERRQRMLTGIEDEEWLWIELDGEHVGFVMTAIFYDEPLPGQRTTEILECYVEPARRRGGVGRAAIEALLAREREHGTALVEAGVLRDNAEALAFWEALGFEVRSLRTARRP
jgi:ribosomal protein S18 acetylase RimI-like enzyme